MGGTDTINVHNDEGEWAAGGADAAAADATATPQPAREQEVAGTVLKGSSSVARKGRLLSCSSKTAPFLWGQGSAEEEVAQEAPQPPPAQKGQKRPLPAGAVGGSECVDVAVKKEKLAGAGTRQGDGSAALKR